MNEEKLQQIFKEMLMLYVKCLRHGIAIQLEKEWADKPEGWYAYFLKLDYENAKKAKVEPITEEVESMCEFDLQACSKTLQYLKDVREVVYRNAGITKALASRINPYYGELIAFRNTYVGHENYTQKQLENYRDDHNKAVEKMHLVLQNAFRDVVDPESTTQKTFFEQFEAYRLDYKNECKSKAYYLSEHLDLTKYDAAKFLPVCKKMGIDTDIVDDKYIFYTYDLKETLALLRNFMAKNGDGQAPQQPISPQSDKNKKQTLRIALIIAGVVVTAALIWGIVSAISGIGSLVGDAFEKVGGEQGFESSLQTMQSQIQQSFSSVTNATSTPTESAASKPINPDANQIPKEYEAKVTALQYADKGRIELMTIRTKVGELASPPSAATWGNGTIYSQNTDIAIAEGLLVRGVAKGETYIAYESDGLCVVYRVVVD